MRLSSLTTVSRKWDVTVMGLNIKGNFVFLFQNALEQFTVNTYSNFVCAFIWFSDFLQGKYTTPQHENKKYILFILCMKMKNILC